FAPSTASNCTFAPSASDLKPSPTIDEWWTNTSLPPSAGVMNPYPFASLNHLTVPVAIQTPPPPRKNGQGKRTVRNQYSLRYRHTVPRQTATSAPSARLGGTGGPDRSRAVEEEGGGDCGGLFDS